MTWSLTDGTASLIQEQRNQADAGEYALIRHLKHEQGRDLGTGSPRPSTAPRRPPSPAYEKWERLTAGNRRPGRSAVRGGRRPAQDPGRVRSGGPSATESKA